MLDRQLEPSAGRPGRTARAAGGMVPARLHEDVAEQYIYALVAARFGP